MWQGKIKVKNKKKGAKKGANLTTLDRSLTVWMSCDLIRALRGPTNRVNRSDLLLHFYSTPVDQRTAVREAVASPFSFHFRHFVSPSATRRGKNRRALSTSVVPRPYHSPTVTILPSTNPNPSLRQPAPFHYASLQRQHKVLTPTSRSPRR